VGITELVECVLMESLFASECNCCETWKDNCRVSINKEHHVAGPYFRPGFEYQASPCGISDGSSGTRTGFSLVTQYARVPVSI